MKWLAVDCHFRSHPKFELVGFWGASVVHAAWEMAKAYDLPNGDMTRFWKVGFIRAWLKLPSENDPAIATAMGAVVEHGLIDLVDNHYLIHDWTDYQRQSQNAIYQQRKRDRARENTTSASVSKSQHESARVSMSHENVSSTLTDIDKDKDIKNEKKPRVIPIVSDTEHPSLILSDEYKTAVVAVCPDHSLVSAITYDQVRPALAATFNILLEKRSYDEILELMKWGLADDYWARIIQIGPEKIDQHWVTMRMKRQAELEDPPKERKKRGVEERPKSNFTPEQLRELEA